MSPPARDPQAPSARDAWGTEADLEGSAIAPALVLVVDDEPIVLRTCERALRSEQLRVELAESGARALELLGQRDVAVLLTDYRMPGMNGIELCERAHRRSPDTVCLLVTGHGDLQVAIAAINRGQIFRILAKPWGRGELRAAVSTALDQHRLFRERHEFELLLQQRNAELRKLNLWLDGEQQRRTSALLLGLINALDLRDTETQGHSRRVALYARLLGQALGLDRNVLLDIERGALLHDIGKIGVSDTILLKPGKLDEAEWAQMRQHVVHGHEILRGIAFLEGARSLVRSHHERWDGKGYPDGIAGEEIPIGARIFAVIDTYDAMTSDRPYRKAMPTEVARKEITTLAGTQLDPVCVAAFLSIPQAVLDELKTRVAENPEAGLE